MTIPPKPGDDVRMKGFAQRSTVADVLTWLDGQTTRLAAQTVPIEKAADRVLAAAVTSCVNVPPFARSMMDGFALRADDTQGASSYNPLALDVIGQSLPGVPSAQSRIWSIAADAADAALDAPRALIIAAPLC